MPCKDPSGEGRPHHSKGGQDTWRLQGKPPKACQKLAEVRMRCPKGFRGSVALLTPDFRLPASRLEDDVSVASNCPTCGTEVKAATGHPHNTSQNQVTDVTDQTTTINSNTFSREETLTSSIAYFIISIAQLKTKVCKTCKETKYGQTRGKATGRNCLRSTGIKGEDSSLPEA